MGPRGQRATYGVWRGSQGSPVGPFHPRHVLCCYDGLYFRLRDDQLANAEINAVLFWIGDAVNGTVLLCTLGGCDS